MQLKCDCCGGLDFSILGNHQDFKDSYWVYCKKCKFIKINPLPTDLQINLFYQSEYGVMRERRGINLNSFDLRAKSQFEFILESIITIKSNLPHKKIRILEIGCGPASLLSLFDDFNVEGIGYEPDSIIFEIAKNRHLRNFTLVNSVFSTNKIMPNSLDLIIMSHVLEHYPNPLEFLKSILPLLTPDGVIFLEVPNLGKRLVLQFIRRRHQDTGHLYYWNIENLSLLIEKIPGTIIKVQTAGPNIKDYNFPYPIPRNRREIIHQIIEKIYSQFINHVQLKQRNKISQSDLNSFLPQKNDAGIYLRMIIKK